MAALGREDPYFTRRVLPDPLLQPDGGRTAGRSALRPRAISPSVRISARRPKPWPAAPADGAAPRPSTPPPIPPSRSLPIVLANDADGASRRPAAAFAGRRFATPLRPDRDRPAHPACEPAGASSAGSRDGGFEVVEESARRVAPDPYLSRYDPRPDLRPAGPEGGVMSAASRIPNLGGATAYRAAPPASGDGGADRASWRRSGSTAVECWPDLPAEALAADFLFFDADLGYRRAVSLDAGRGADAADRADRLGGAGPHRMGARRTAPTPIS